MLAKLNHRLIHYALLLTVGGLLFLLNLGAPSLWDVDEGRNSEAAREMMESGNWIVPTFNYELRTDKPALLYWLQIAAFRLFGLGEFAARLPSALAAIATVLLTYEMGRRMFDARTGLLAGIVLSTTLGLCGAAHFANPDALLCACTVLTLFAFWNSYARGDRLWLVLCGVSTGLAVLAKGPVGLALPGAVIVLFLMWERQWKMLLSRRLAIGLALFVLVAGPWYAWVGADTKGAFLRGFIMQHNIERFGSPAENHSGSIFYYLIVIVAGLGPWSVFLVPACWRALGRGSDAEAPFVTSTPSDANARMPACYRFLWVWIAVYMVFFSVAHTKLPNYILPLYPAVALLLARYLERWRRGEYALGAFWGLISVVGLAAFAMAIVMGCLTMSGFFGHVTSSEVVGLLPFAAVGAFGLGAAVLMALLLRRGQRLAVTVTFAIVLIITNGIAAAFAIPTLNQLKSTRAMGQVIRDAAVERELQVVAYRCFEPSVVFYCRHEVNDVDGEDQVLEYFRYPTQVCVIMPVTEWERLRGRIGTQCRILDTSRDLYLRQDVIALTNR